METKNPYDCESKCNKRADFLMAGHMPNCLSKARMENKDCCKVCRAPKYDRMVGENYCTITSCPCHSKAPEKKCDGKCYSNDECVCEAPTDESWRKAFASKFNIAYVKDKGFAFLGVEITDWISELLQKEREKAQLDRGECLTKGYKEGELDGKSEAFSLVRNFVQKVKRDVSEFESIEAAIDYGKLDDLAEYAKDVGYNNALIDLLSTLEGK